GGDDVLLQHVLDTVGEPLEEAGRSDAVRPDAALDPSHHAAFDPGRDARDRQHEAEDDDPAEKQHGAEVGRPDGHGGRGAEQRVDELLHQRSISGATRSKLAITAIRSAIIRFLLTFGTMLMAENEPVRILQRYGNEVPSLTT